MIRMIKRKNKRDLLKNEQSTLLIIGNGFDLACGLKSGYLDFYKSCVKDNIGGQFGLTQTKAGEQYGFWEKLLLEYEGVYGLKDYLWCNIEEIIRQTMLSICDVKSNYKPAVKGFQEAVNLCKRDSSNGVVLEDVIQSWIGNYCMRFYLEQFMEKIAKAPATIYTSLPNYAQEAICTHLLQELKGLESRFCKFINYQLVNSINPKETNIKYLIKVVNLLNRILEATEHEFKDWEWCKSNADLESSHPPIKEFYDALEQTSIFSFNYTTPLTYFQFGIHIDDLELFFKYQYTNVHGKHCRENCKACAKSNIIFGIDEKAIESDYLRIFTKTYRLMQSGDNISQGLPPKTKLEKIKFFGHSLSEADYSYFQSIFDYYEIYSNS